MSRRTTVVPCLVIGLLVAACGTERAEPDPTGPTRPDRAWVASSAPVPTTGLVWATDTTVHLGDGTTIDTGTAMATYVVAGDGVYFVPDGDSDGALFFADRSGTVVPTGIDILADSLSASPDGTHLAVIDIGSGEKDDYGTHQAVVRVFDLPAGKEEVTATDGMGDPDTDDLAVSYEEHIGIPLMTDRTAYVEGLGEEWAYDLGDGSGKVLASGESVPRPDLGATTSPDGGWAIVDRGHQDQLRSPDGSTVAPAAGTPRWDLLWWADATTVVGAAVTGPGSGDTIDPADTLELMTCTVPDLACTVHDGTAGVRIAFPRGRTEDRAVTFQKGT